MSKAQALLKDSMHPEANRQRNYYNSNKASAWPYLRLHTGGGPWECSLHNIVEGSRCNNAHCLPGAEAYVSYDKTYLTCWAGYENIERGYVYKTVCFVLFCKSYESLHIRTALPRTFHVHSAGLLPPASQLKVR